MQDKLYVDKDIPSDYKYFDFHDGYVDLYNKQSFYNESTTVYRIYYSVSPNTYYTYQRTFNNYNNYTFVEYERTSDICYRSDFPQIVFTSLSFIIVFIFLINIMTSCFKKGGVFHGLL